MAIINMCFFFLVVFNKTFGGLRDIGSANEIIPRVPKVRRQSVACTRGGRGGGGDLKTQRVPR